jgi:hypothetical protein
MMSWNACSISFIHDPRQLERDSGLAICRGVVNAHGGRIWAANRPEGGAVFRFTVSLRGLSCNPTKETVVIEDEPAILTFLRSSLQDNWEVTEARTGRIGLELAARNKPDVILLDLGLAGSGRPAGVKVPAKMDFRAG